MRISDWSSDVCSSDLAEADAIAVAVAAAEIAGAADRARIDEAAGHAAAIVAVERGAPDIDAAACAGNGARIGDVDTAGRHDAEPLALDSAPGIARDPLTIFLPRLAPLGHTPNPLTRSHDLLADLTQV